MKKMRKLIAVVLALTVAMTMGIASTSMVFAADDGSISVTNATRGQTYEAFLIFPAHPSDPSDLSKGVTYTATAAQVAVSGFDNVFTKVANSSGGYNITKKTGVRDDDVVAFVKQNKDTLKQGSAISGTWADNDTVTFSGLPYGYYFVTSTLGTVISVDTAGKNVTVVDKNESTPGTPDKDITAEDSSINEALDQTGKELDANNAAVGSVESFQVDFNATNWVKASADPQTAGSGTEGTKVTEYNFKDTPTGLEIDPSTVKVYVNWGTSAQQEITSTITGTTVSDAGVLTFTIPWVGSNGKHLYATQTANSEAIPVHVTYDAKVLDAAATAVAPNTIEVLYNNNPENSLGTSTTNTYTYKFKLEKLDENKKALDGAQFELYYASSGTTSVGNALKFKLVDGVYHYDPEGTVTRIAPTGTDATALIVGLDDTNYVLKEVVVPEGYNQAEDKAVSGLSRVEVADASVTKISVENKKGSVLPSTGGIGTTIFYILGALLVVGCGIILIARRRSSANN